MDTYVSAQADRVTAGTLFKRSGRIWLRHFVAFTLLSLVVRLPIVVFYVVCSTTSLADKRLMGWIASADVALESLVAAVLAHAVVTQLRGQPLVFAESLRLGLRSLGSALGVGLAVALLVGLGHFAYNVPALFVQTALLLAVPAAVIERTGFTFAFARSWRLTAGYRWSLFVSILLVSLITFGVGLLAAAVFRHGRDWTPGLRLSVRYFVAGAGALMGAWLPVLANVAFHDLRRLKEGVDVSSLTRVFE